ncbi:MAG: OB-fold nucleic acid binding domain-containing protein [Prevotella sp.]|nr:OB-fold nucleic acid binding domain-containing protein [Prevotella sp.]
MKKIIYSVFMMVMVTMAFTSCADVPMPYDDPNQAAIDDGGGSTVEPAGSGTVDDPYNVAAANALIESGEAPGTNVYVKGKIVSIKEIDTGSFGNATFYISDDGTSKDQLTVYRSKSLGNKNFKSEEEIKDGDEVVICGVLVNYNGTYEFTQGCYIYSLNGETSGGGTPSGPVAGSGTLEDPYNVAAISQLAASLASNAKSDNVYFKGKVSSIKENFGTKYGNATFNISDDGTTNGEFLIFQCLYLGNVKYTEGDLLKEGDEVIIYGKVTNYQGNTPESSKGEAYVYSLNGKTEGPGGGGGGSTGTPSGTGTEADPYNVAAITNVATALASNAKSDDVYFKGKVVSIVNDKNGKAQNYDSGYGNAVFYISDDGTSNGQFLVYRALYFDNKDYTSGDVLKVGDEVIMHGKVTNYNGNTPESSQKECYLYSLNGKKSDGSSSGGGGSSSGDAVAKDVSGNTLTLTVNGVTASSNKVSVDFNAQGWKDAQEVSSVTLSDGTVINISKGEGSTTPKFYDGTKGIRLYAKNTLTITSANKGIAKVVLTCDKQGSTDYIGNETLKASSSGKSMTITNEHTSASGGTQLRVQTMEITYAQ